MVDLRHRLTRRRFAMAALATPAMAGLLAACGGDDDDEPAATSTSASGQGATTATASGGQGASTPSGGSTAAATGTATSTAAATESGSGQTIAPEDQTPVVIVQGVEPPSLDPQYSESGALANITNTIFDTLVAYSQDMELVGEAAETWELLEDNKTWQFKLHEGITFWNGEPLNSEAVKFTMERIGNEELRSAGLNDPYYSRVGFDHVEVIDDLTFNVVLTEPTILFLPYTSFVSILEPKHYTDNSPQETAINPMGSGPWMFEEWVKDDHLTLKANPDYFLGKPPIETVIFKPVPEGSTRMAMLEAGEADIVQDVSPEDIKRIDAADNIRSCITNDGRRVHIGLPTEHELFSDRRVRQALNYAVNFDAINEAILGGVAMGRMAVPVNGEFWVDPSIEPYPYDPDMAKQLLEEAGWDPDTEITIYSPIGRYLKDAELAQAVAGEWQKVGVKAQAQTMEYSVFSEMGRNSEFDMPYLIGYGSRHFGPDDLNVLFEPGFQGYEWVENTERGPEAKALIEELQGTFDDDRQQEIVFEVCRIFKEEAPWLFLWKQVGLFGVSERIDWMCGGKARTELWYAGGEPTQFTS